MKKSLLFETRILDVFDKLKPYMLENDIEKPEYFISFQNILKIGLNPSSKYIGIKKPEPYGFYATPLKYWENIYEMLSDNDIQFPDRKYLFLITFKPGSKILYLDDFSKPLKAWERIIERSREKYFKTKNPSIALTKYLISDMGVDVIVDNVGNVMSPIETYEAVFLKPSVIKVINVFELNPDEIEIFMNSYNMAINLLDYLLDQDYKRAQIAAEALYGKELAITIIKTINSFMKDWSRLFPSWLSGKEEFVKYLLYMLVRDEEFEDYDLNTIQTVLEEEYEELKEIGNKEKLKEFYKFIDKYHLDDIFELENR